MKKKTLFLFVSIISLTVVFLLGCGNNEISNSEESIVLMDKDSCIISSQQYTNEFFHGDLKKIYNSFSKEMKTAMSVSDLSDFKKRIEEGFGNLVTINSESVDSQSIEPLSIYSATSSYSSFEGELLIQWILNREMGIEGFYITVVPSLADSDYLQYETKSELKLPFKDEWFVFWGGRTIEENYHAAYSDQRFAYDFVQVKKGKSCENDGKKNSDYYAFGKTILAPAAGKIVEMVNNIEDNVPGVMNSINPLGNYVIIDHLNGEYSFMAHFQEGSILVEIGDSVSIGQEIGKCGNSGNSSEPHLHYHLQNSAIFSKGDGLPAFFQNYYANGELVKRGEPAKNQIVNMRLE